MLHRLVQDGLHRLKLALFDLEHELIVDLQQDAALDAGFPELAVGAIIASLMTSAAVPCIGVFIAMRSASMRWLKLRLLMAGSSRRRPNIVVT